MAKDMAPDKYHNPYHFVPACLTDHGENHKHWLDLPEATPANRIEPFHRKVIEEDTLARRLGHDSYRTEATSETLYSGRLICRLKNSTPMFIGGRRTRDADDLHPAEVEPFELEPGEPALPASSLRGLIASIAEAASGSSLRVLHDGMLSYRKEARAAFKGRSMIVLHQGSLRLLPLPVPRPNPPQIIKVDGKLVQDKESFRWDKKEFYYVRKDSQAYNERKIRASKDLMTEAQYKSEIKDNPGKEDNYDRGILRILGCEQRTDLPKDRRYELFIPFPYQNKEELSALALEKTPAIPPEVISRFEQLADERTQATEEQNSSPYEVHPYHPKGTERNQNPDEPPKDLRHKLRLKEGDIVYFNTILDGEGKPVVDEIAFSSIWRGRVEYMEDNEKKAATVWRFFEEIGEDLVPFHAGRTRLSPAELLFGFVQEDKKPEKKEGENRDKDQESLAYAGRVRFSFGRLAQGETSPFYLPPPPVTLKILASPKPPSPALYFKHKTGENDYIPKTERRKKQPNGQIKTTPGLNLNDHIPQGRKFYLHHPYTGCEEELPWETRKPTDNLKQKVSITPIAPHKVFYFHVDFTNLSAWELGLLCYALRPTDGTGSV